MQKFYQRSYACICFHVISRQVLLAHQWDTIFKDIHFANSFQDFFFVRSTEYALVSQKTVSINLPPKSNKPHHEDYFVGLVITQNPWTDTDRHTLKLNYFILLTSQAELFPSDPVDSKSGEFKAMVLQELSGRVRTCRLVHACCCEKIKTDNLQHTIMIIPWVYICRSLQNGPCQTTHQCKEAGAEIPEDEQNSQPAIVQSAGKWKRIGKVPYKYLEYEFHSWCSFCVLMCLHYNLYWYIMQKKRAYILLTDNFVCLKAKNWWHDWKVRGEM